MGIMKPLMTELVEYKKMPLKSILKSNLRKATETLLEISKTLCIEGCDQYKLRALSDKLYSEIPFIDSKAPFQNAIFNK